MWLREGDYCIFSISDMLNDEVRGSPEVIYSGEMYSVCVSCQSSAEVPFQEGTKGYNVLENASQILKIVLFY